MTSYQTGGAASDAGDPDHPIVIGSLPNPEADAVPSGATGGIGHYELQMDRPDAPPEELAASEQQSEAQVFAQFDALTTHTSYGAAIEEMTISDEGTETDAESPEFDTPAEPAQSGPHVRVFDGTAESPDAPSEDLATPEQQEETGFVKVPDILGEAPSGDTDAPVEEVATPEEPAETPDITLKRGTIAGGSANDVATEELTISHEGIELE